MRSDTPCTDMKNVLPDASYTCELYPYERLFSPIRCGALTLKNRVIAAAPRRLYGETREGFALKAASGGAAMICLDSGFDAELCRSIHALGGKIFANLASERPLKLYREARDAIKIGCDGVCLDLRSAGKSQAAALVKAVRRAIGEERAIMCRLGASGTYCELAECGADMLSVEPSEGAPCEAMPAGCFLEAARRAKQGTAVVVAASGKLGYPDAAEAALQNEMCDMIILSRSLLSDPDWCKKAQAGAVCDIAPYINPQAALLTNPCAEAENKKRVAVVGGGVSGMSLALCAARRGHSVGLFESAGKLGRRMLFEGGADTLSYRQWLIRRLCRANNAEIYLNSYVDAAYLADCGYEVIVYANGGKPPAPPNISGWGEIPFVPLWVLAESQTELAGKHVAVLGGGKAACECALRIKKQCGAQRVTLIEQGAGIMRGCDELERRWYEKTLEAQGVELLTAATPLRIADGSLFVSRCCYTALGTAPSKERFIRQVDCGLIVCAQEETADLSQFQAAQSELPALTIYNLTGSFSPCDIASATRAAYKLASKI